MRRRTDTWLAGGIGLVVCGAAGLVQGAWIPAVGGGSVLAIFSAAVWAASVFVLARGLGPAGSIVARKPVGSVALAVLAVWPLVDTITGLAALPVQDPATIGGWTAWGYVSLAVPFAAALVAVTQIGRAGVVPSPWNWAPAWVLAARAVFWVVPQIVVTAVGPTVPASLIGPMIALQSVGLLAATLGLGILALVIAARERGAEDARRAGPAT